MARKRSGIVKVKFVRSTTAGNSGYNTGEVAAWDHEAARELVANGDAVYWPDEEHHRGWCDDKIGEEGLLQKPTGLLRRSTRCVTVEELQEATEWLSDGLRQAADVLFGMECDHFRGARTQAAPLVSVFVQPSNPHVRPSFVQFIVQGNDQRRTNFPIDWPDGKPGIRLASKLVDECYTRGHLVAADLSEDVLVPEKEITRVYREIVSRMPQGMRWALPFDTVAAVARG